MEAREKISTIPEIPGLEFDENGHIYRLDGIIIPSVSAVMAPLSKVKYEGINSKTLEKAASKGTSVHNAIENWLKFDIEDVPPEYQGYFGAFRMWWDKYKPEVVGSEIRMCHRLMRYAGTADLIAYIDGELTLVDYKTTYTISDMTCGVQLEAYAQALENMGVKVQKKGILHLKKDGSYELRGYPIKDAGRWRVFGALKTVYDYIESFE